MASLRNKALKGLFWSFLDSFGVYLVKFGFSIVIARTLSPDDYGLMGMIVIFISLGQMIMQSGFSMALIQKREADTTDFSTAFWFNFITAVVVYLILFFTARAIASFFGEPLLVSITRVTAIGIILNALCSIQVSIQTKRMNFRRLTWINLVSALASGTTGLVMALRGFEVWALIFQTLAGNVIYLAGLWITTDWKPQFVFSIQSFRGLFKFGYKVLLQGLTDVLFTKSYFPLIGKFFTVSQLGYYTNASRFYDIFVHQTANSVTRVIFPAFSSIQHEEHKFSSNYTKSFNLLALIMFLGSVVMIISSRPFVSIALTEKWLPAVPFMQLFFVDGFFFPLMMFNLNILYSFGKGGDALKIDIFRKSLIMIGILVLIRYGIRALIAGQVFATLAALIYTSLTIMKFRGICVRSILVPLLKLTVISGLCLIMSFLLTGKITISDWTELIMKLTLIPAVFLLLTRLILPESLINLKEFIIEFRLR